MSRDQGKTDFLAKPCIGDRKCRGTLDFGMASGQGLDPCWINIVTAANDDVLLPPGYSQIAVSIDPAEVAGHEPTAGIERIFGRLLIVEIAEHQTCATTTDLADLADRGFN